MNWDTLFSLQGHGPYILGAYGVTIALMAWEVLAVWRRSRRALEQRDAASIAGGSARGASAAVASASPDRGSSASPASVAKSDSGTPP